MMNLLVSLSLTLSGGVTQFVDQIRQIWRFGTYDQPEAD
jgi:hypothetical protein